MRTIFLAVMLAACTLTLIIPFELPAADVQKGATQRQDINVGIDKFVRYSDNGPSSWGEIYTSDSSLAKRKCCFRHPTTLSYHPEVYNYRHFYDIVGHESFYSVPHYLHPLPAGNLPEEILTPAPEQDGQLPPLSGSARLSRGNQKNIRK